MKECCEEPTEFDDLDGSYPSETVGRMDAAIEPPGVRQAT